MTLAKSRGLHIILGLVFGPLGFHNFYAGHNTRGAIKVGLTMLMLFMDTMSGFETGFSVIALVITGLWSLVEIIAVRSDAAGVPMK